jgi:hypothetical protein
LVKNSKEWKKCREYLKKLIDEVYKLNNLYTTYKNFYKLYLEKNYLFEIIDIMMIYIFDSLLNNIIITLSKLYEDKRSNYSIGKFLHFIESNQRQLGVYKTSILCEIRKKYDEIYSERKIKELITLRDKEYAHNDSAKNSILKFEETNVKLELIIRDTIEIMQFIYLKIEDKEIILDDENDEIVECIDNLENILIRKNN